MNLYVGNLDYAVKESQITAMFSEFGAVSSVKLITDKFTGRSKGFAFVEMSNDDEAREAINQLNQKAINDRNISVSEAQPPEKRERPPFGGGGGGNRDRKPFGNNGGGPRDRDRRRF
ncbi:MAG TPA: RNA-binding protein [Saprospiraceae bacterium]|jgi:RNA recognition motif-containing protein|nr:RNA-binding protein [Saprospiraceae bacterium]HOJ91018.1 RNA-binding protein [Saprospiraceae bacterium]HUN17043.1 RNA-binding protein [Saprospiraceae bacterium]